MSLIFVSWRNMFPLSHKYLITIYIDKTWPKTNMLFFSLIFLYFSEKINFKISTFNYVSLSYRNISIAFVEKYTLNVYYISLMKTHINNFTHSFRYSLTLLKIIYHEISNYWLPLRKSQHSNSLSRCAPKKIANHEGYC